MTNTKFQYPPSYTYVTDGLINDYKRFAAHKRTEEIIQLLEEQLERNKTRTMTFTEDGLTLAIKMIKELYGIAN